MQHVELTQRINNPGLEPGLRWTPWALAGLHAGVLRSETASPSSALVLHLHSGAFESRPISPSASAQSLAAAGATVVMLDYPLARGSVFPHTLEAVYAAIWRVARERRQLAGDPNAKIFVAGEEAGGTLAAGVAMMARDRKQIRLRGQILFWPLLDPMLASASMRRVQAGHARCPWTHGWRSYLSSCADVTHPYAAPLYASRLVGLPPALVVTPRNAGQRDEALLYASRLEARGVAVSRCLLDYRGHDAPDLSAKDIDGALVGQLLTALAGFLNQVTAP